VKSGWNAHGPHDISEDRAHGRAVTAMSSLVVVEDDLNVQFLIETVFSLDSRFPLTGATVAAEEALEMARSAAPGIFVLDHALAGELTGLEAAPQLKLLAPESKIIFFTAHAQVREAAARARDRRVPAQDRVDSAAPPGSATERDAPTGC